MNADEIEKEVKESLKFDFTPFKVKVDFEKFKKFFTNQGISVSKLDTAEIIRSISLNNNAFIFAKQINSYIAADIAAFLRIELLNNKVSFSIETVFLTHQN